MRIEAWDFLKTMTIFLVVLGHCLQYMIDGNPHDIVLYSWISSFHMPLFATLSGLFSIKALKTGNFLTFLKKRCQRLLLPAIIWGILIWVVDILIFDDLSLSLFIKDAIYESLWFLKCLFICNIFGVIAFKHQNRKKWILISLIISQFIPVWNICIMYPCFVFGMFITKYFEIFLKYQKYTLIISGIMFFTISLLIAFTPQFWIITHGVKEALINGILFKEENYPIIQGILIRNYGKIFTGIFGSIFLIIGSYVLTQKFSMPHFFYKVAKSGKYTIGVYLIQTIIIEMLLAPIINIPQHFSTPFIYIFFPILSLLTVYISLLITRLICENYGILALALFGETSKNNATKIIST